MVAVRAAGSSAQLLDSCHSSTSTGSATSVTLVRGRYGEPVPVTRSPVSPEVAAGMAVIYVVWGSTYLAVAFVVETMPPLVASGLRFILAGIFIAALVWGFRGRRALLAGRGPIITASLIGGLMIGIGNGALALAVQHVSSGLAALVIAITPVWIALLRLVVHQRPRLLTWLGIVMGLAGVALLLGPGGGGASPAWSVALVVGSLAWAVASFLTTQVTMPADPFAGAAWEMLAGGATSVVLGLLLGERITGMAQGDVRSWVAFGYLSIIAAIAFAVYVWLLTNAPISLVATYAYVNPLVAVALGVLFNNEVLTAAILIGGGVVLAGVVMVVAGERRPTPVADSA